MNVNPNISSSQGTLQEYRDIQGAPVPSIMGGVKCTLRKGINWFSDEQQETISTVLTKVTEMAVTEFVEKTAHSLGSVVQYIDPHEQHQEAIISTVSRYIEHTGKKIYQSIMDTSNCKPALDYDPKLIEDEEDSELILIKPNDSSPNFTGDLMNLQAALSREESSMESDQ